MTREELIATLETATGTSYDLDVIIWNHIGRPDTRTHDGTPCVLCYTASIDAALTLVPAEMDWCISIIEPGPYAVVGNNNPAYMAHTPALALCIAALKARGE
jgi:hypothetical protein